MLGWVSLLNTHTHAQSWTFGEASNGFITFSSKEGVDRWDVVVVVVVVASFW